MTTAFARPDRWPVFVALFCLVLVALLLRLYRLDALSLWYDEGATLAFAAGGVESWTADNHPPLYYALMNFWLQFGQSEYWMRLLSVLPAVATVPVVFGIGRQMFGVRAGLLAALFVSLMAFHIAYSQEARMYALFAFFYACTLWSLISAARGEWRWHWIGYVVAATGLAYSHGIGIVYVATLALLFPLIARRPLQASAWVPFILANGLVAVLYLPWLDLISQADLRLGNIAWMRPPDMGTLLRTFTTLSFENIPLTGLIGKLTGVEPERPVAVLLFGLPVLLLAAISLWRAATHGRGWAAAVAVLSVVLPVAAVYALSVLLTPIYVNRVLLPVCIGFALLLAGALPGAFRTPALVWLLILVNLAIVGLNTFYYFRYSAKEDYRALSQDLQREVQPGEPILFVEASSLGRVLVKYYDADSRLAAAPATEIQDLIESCDGGAEPCLPLFFQNYLQTEHIWIVYIHDHVLLPEGRAAQRWLSQNLITVSNRFYDSERLRLVKAALPGP